MFITVVIPLRRSNQVSYEDTDVGSWSFVVSNEPVRNECEVIHEVFHILKYFIYFRLLNAIPSIAFTTARIIAYLISHPQFTTICNLHLPWACWNIIRVTAKWCLVFTMR